jgi:hypothetical protein
LPEVNELFEGWNDHPPLNVMVQILVESFSGVKFGKAAEVSPEGIELPSEAMVEMTKSAMAGIEAKAGNRLPIVRGKDKGLPKEAPVFNVDELRLKNAEIIRKRAEARRNKVRV